VSDLLSRLGYPTQSGLNIADVFHRQLRDLMFMSHSRIYESLLCRREMSPSHRSKIKLQKSDETKGRATESATAIAVAAE